MSSAHHMLLNVLFCAGPAPGPWGAGGCDWVQVVQGVLWKKAVTRPHVFRCGDGGHGCAPHAWRPTQVFTCMSSSFSQVCGRSLSLQELHFTDEKMHHTGLKELFPPRSQQT